ncbi:uncharacterized protein [Tenebrio molitor]|uniref:uncharacterized protein isoform X2 n=1 Tax=Tenebrio molitor TaxID=7067 RepID=UPI00362471EB
MSVSDPLIKDIKGCTLKLFTESLSKKITDSSQDLQDFCQILEKIFHRGLTQTQTSFYGNKKTEVYTWMSSLAAEETALESFNYRNSVQEVQSTKHVQTPLGKFRLLVRHCLMKKCLHFSLQYLNNSNKAKLFYDKHSIIGDEILSAILLSVFLQCNKINFELDLTNCAFLDLTWQTPDLVKLELVPCKNLGISISFSENKAVIVHVKSNSVASESGEICTGDILSNLNGVEINSSCKGRLNAIFRANKGKPINLVVVKAFHKQSQDVFAPVKTILEKLQIDPVKITNRSQSEHTTETATCAPKSTKSGYSATYLGLVSVGNNGSVRQIEEAIKRRLSMTKSDTQKPVIFEIGEMNIKVLDSETGGIVFKHSYMQISSCGSVPALPNYVAYIAGDENCDTASNFVCYIFHVQNIEDACTILQSIGQGFGRTHFAV